MTDEEKLEEVDDFDLFIEEKNQRIKELENDRHELLEIIKAIKEILNILENYTARYEVGKQE